MCISEAECSSRMSTVKLPIIQFHSGKRQYFTCDAIQFSTASQLSEEECYVYLHKYMADHVKEGNKTLQMLFIR